MSVYTAKIEMKVICDPLSEESRSDECAEAVTNLDAVARFDGRLDVEDPRDESLRKADCRGTAVDLDDDQMVAIDGVGAIRTAA